MHDKPIYSTDKPAKAAPTKTADQARLAAENARILANNLRKNGAHTPDQQRQLKLYESLAKEYDAEAGTAAQAEAEHQKKLDSPAYLNAKAHAESFARTTSDPDRANVAFDVLNSGDVEGYFQIIRDIETAEYNRRETDRVGKDEARCKAELEHAKAAAAATEAKHRLEQLP